MLRSRTAFTMMEMMLAIALAVIVMALAIPTIGSMFAEDPLQKSFKQFEEFVRKAQSKAVKEHRTYLLVWEKGAITLQPQVLTEEDAQAEPESFSLGNSELTLERPFSLEKKPAAEWPFWKSGTCEPVRVAYKGDGGSWLAEFDPLTTRGTIVEADNR